MSDALDLQRTLESERLARLEAERLLEQKNHELYRASLRLQRDAHQLETGVAERLQAEMSLRVSEERFRALIQNTPIGMYRVSLSGRVDLANPALLRMMGWTSLAEWEKSPAGIQIGPSTPERRTFFARLQETGIVHGWESTWIHRDGHEVYVREHARTVIAEGESLFSYEGTVEDISDRRKSELEMKKLNSDLVSASRLAGMAEVATDVLHNVGNVLNSVNISTTLIREKLESSRVAHLTRAADMLREHEADLAAFLSEDPKGKRLPSFLLQLQEQLMEENRFLRKEIEVLEENLRHIKQTVSTQQSYARVIGVSETLPLDQLVEDALKLSGASLDRHGIDLIREYQPVPPGIVDRHRVLQILVNLLQNAKRALLDGETSQKTITISIDSPYPGRLRLRVTDTGIGISPENLKNIFRHGFTTRRDGHGFGLHSSALAAQEMKGRLSVESPGPGLGATFTLELPAELNTLAP